VEHQAWYTHEHDGIKVRTIIVTHSQPSCAYSLDENQ